MHMIQNVLKDEGHCLYDMQLHNPIVSKHWVCHVDFFPKRNKSHKQTQSGSMGTGSEPRATVFLMLAFAYVNENKAT